MPPLPDGWILHCDTDVQGQIEGGREDEGVPGGLREYRNCTEKRGKKLS